jgi:hypothetical protein
MAATTAGPRGARLPGRMTTAIRSRLAKPAARARTAVSEMAGTLLAPLITATPAARASASSAPMPATKRRPSARSR